MVNNLPVANGVLCLHTEQEGRGEVLVCKDAGREGAVLNLFKILLIIIPVGEGNDPPDNNFPLIFCLNIFRHTNIFTRKLQRLARRA